jgi:hypothetical protein
MGRRKTHEEFLVEVSDLVQDEYSVIGEYTGTTSKIKVKHNKCGYEYVVMPSSFLQGNRCPKCSKKASQRIISNLFKKQT